MSCTDWPASSACCTRPRGGIDERAIVVWKKGTAPPASKASDRVSDLLEELRVAEGRARAAAVINKLVILRVCYSGHGCGLRTWVA